YYPDIFAGGDAVTGPKFAIDAIAAGKQAAVSISRLFRGRNLTDGRNAEYHSLDASKVSIPITDINTTPRQHAPEVDHARAIHSFNDLRKGLTEDQIIREAGRCLHCGRSVVDVNKCIGCGVCTHRCEFDAIHLVRVDDTQFAQNMNRWYGRLAKNIVKRGVNIAAEEVTSLVRKDGTHA
ncbi:MAG: 4Fe-4S binding protein, partial [Bulleidia sp.]